MPVSLAKPPLPPKPVVQAGDFGPPICKVNVRRR